MKKHDKSASTPDHNLAASIGRNTLFGIISNLVQVGTRLVTVPVVIHHLGLGGYGIWNIIMMTATYMRFGSVGVKTAFQKYVAEATGNGDYELANRLLSTGCAVMLVLSLAALIPAAFFSLPIAKLAGVPPEFLKSAAGAISLLAYVGAAFESIVMGGHRIDLVRKFGTVLTVCEAVVIIIVLHFGYGLFAMAGVMGASELVYILCCYFASLRIVPQVRVSIEFLSKDVLYELFRFAGSYQLVNLLEVLYVSLLPFAILRAFGAESAGAYAVVTRIVASAGVLLEAFLPSILSGGTMVYASGSSERMQALLVKAFKVTLALLLFPLGFICTFGTTMTFAWTGETSVYFRGAFWLVSLTAMFRSFSLLALVLYRVSGRALLDNIRQALRILVILFTVVFARKLGFYGVLGGMATAELLGMIFMLFALTHTFPLFRAKSLLPDAARSIIAAGVILGVGALASYIPIPVDMGGRAFATLKMAEIGLACVLAAWPTMLYTRSVTAAEGRALFGAFLSKRTAS
jgi:O-antigen/teichoic acid export membrane protein